MGPRACPHPCLDPIYFIHFCSEYFMGPSTPETCEHSQDGMEMHSVSLSAARYPFGKQDARLPLQLG